MKYYASRTGTKRNLAAMRDAGWGLLISRTGVWRNEGFEYVLDNGRWTDSQEDPPRPFDAEAQADFVRLVDEFGAGATWLVVPDTVGDRDETLALAREWIPRLKGKCRLLLVAVQDGMKPNDVKNLVGSDIGIFLGGTTEYKMASMRVWGKFCRRRGLYFHVGRVNSERRIKSAKLCHADSVDGSGGSRFAVVIPRLEAAMERARRQGDMFD